MADVYISGALTAIADGASARVFYELLAEIVTECGLRPYLPHRATDPVGAPDLDPRSVYEIDRARVARSGLVIAYAGTPSTEPVAMTARSDSCRSPRPRRSRR